MAAGRGPAHPTSSVIACLHILLKMLKPYVKTTVRLFTKIGSVLQIVVKSLSRKAHVLRIRKTLWDRLFTFHLPRSDGPFGWWHTQDGILTTLLLINASLKGTGGSVDVEIEKSAACAHDN